ncbi:MULTISPECIES: hypothetical protein [unclassified Rhizobium]|uniref:hypothetical protein n=1 Tax=unclassified Rhizobium TaxID=2613769 RepID=UPI0006FBCAC3|nr:MULTISPECIES: hypothetical protein [unclassified Rhizobium]KQV35762.1 hypothetical protein ASC86_11230 [Rhizobium sp. Root1212]KRD25869.1 hypothetical protein ASE37_11225 [Rhizobium sp. Root268]
MTTIKHMTAPAYSTIADVETMKPSLNALIEEIVAPALSTDLLRRALSAGINEITTILRAVPVAEGRLLERGIALIANLNADLVVLSGNLRLPVTKAATELVEMNDPKLYRSLSLDADSGGRKSYTPDLLILNQRTEVVHLVDVKRSLGSYEVSRIAELKNRMLAAALVVPDLLYKEHRRLQAKEVRVVILNAENQRTDIDGGVWPLSHLDHLLEVEGAGEVMANMRHLFQTRIELNWNDALQDHRDAKVTDVAEAERLRLRGAASEIAQPAVPPELVGRGASRPPIQIGFAQAPRAAPH